MNDPARCGSQPQRHVARPSAAWTCRSRQVGVQSQGFLRGRGPREGTYLEALNWCITTLTTVGYGDVTPTTQAQTIYTMATMILGVGIYGYVIGNVANLLTKLDLVKANYQSTLERLAGFMRYRKISPPMQQLIFDYYAYLWDNRMGYDEAMVLADLPPTLQAELSLLLKRDVICAVPVIIPTLW